MVRIQVEIVVNAPIEVVFDAVRDLELHSKALSWTGEKILSGPAGLIEFGDEITFEARHFGMRQRLTARITEFERPNRFVDVMIRGAFKSLSHEHLFQEVPEGTRLTDVVQLTAPLGLFGWMAERLFLGTYMRRLLNRKNEALKEAIEALRDASER